MPESSAHNLQFTWAFASIARKEFAIMKAFGDDFDQLRLKTDFQRGVVFALLAIAIFALLLIAERPHWAEPWLIASLFTFAVWRLNRQQSR